MILKDLIEFLEKHPEEKRVKTGFGNPHSYRGHYYELAFEVIENTTVGEMLESAKSALGETYQGYKGGNFQMNEYTDCHLAKYGCCGEEIGITLLNLMIGETDD